MTALATDAHLEFKHVGNTLRKTFPVVADDIIYAHSFVGRSGANARPLTAGDTFLGIAVNRQDNTGGAAGDKVIETEAGHCIKLTIIGIDNSKEGVLVYATDDGTPTLTKGSNSLIGIVEQFISGTTAWVKVLTSAEAARIEILDARVTLNDAK